MPAACEVVQADEERHAGPDEYGVEKQNRCAYNPRKHGCMERRAILVVYTDVGASHVSPRGGMEVESGGDTCLRRPNHGRTPAPETKLT